MLKNRPLRIEVLVNSPGPHDQVRIRDPFLAMQKLGLDCRIHEKPFLFNSCIRPNSLVIWQRPLPANRIRQWEHLQWLRERGCLLFTEWDDHPDLFNSSIRKQLEEISMAPLELCHCIHSSSTRLVKALSEFNPLGLVIDNAVSEVPKINLQKHQERTLRVLIGNQNRLNEHEKLSEGICSWIRINQNIKLVIIADKVLKEKLPKERVEFHKLLNYNDYRSLLASCHIALLPLAENTANWCKTPIKQMECAAESVASVAGPALYKSSCPSDCAVYVNQVQKIIGAAEILAKEHLRRQDLVKASHQWVEKEWSLQKHLAHRIWLYKSIWTRRKKLDSKLVFRLNKKNEFPKMYEKEFHL